MIPSVFSREQMVARQVVSARLPGTRRNRLPQADADADERDVRAWRCDAAVQIVSNGVGSVLARGTGTWIALQSLWPMNERRRAARFLLADPGVGSLRMVQDVEITYVGSHQAVVVAPSALPNGERLLLEIPAARHASPYTVLAHVADNRVVMDDGSLRREVRLKLVDATRRNRGFGGVQIPRGRSVMGALIRRVPVRVVEASTAGCVFESPSNVIEGSVGFVWMRTAIREHSEAVRVRRTSQTSDLLWQYRMAAEFLTLGPISPESLRGFATIVTAGPPAATDH
jgi:hypothetical protein